MTANARILGRVVSAMVGITYALLVFGSTVRAHGAGLACPDWPLCFGEIVPRIDFGVGLEFGHRVLAGCVSVLFAGVAVAIFRDRSLRARFGALVGVLAAVLVVQVILGGLTVLHLLAEWTVTSHLVAGNTFALLLLLLAAGLREADRPVGRDAVPALWRWGAVLFALLVPVQLVLGGLVSSTYSGLACGTWPSCNGGAWFPTLEGAVGLQVAHRIVAYSLLAAALINVVITRGRGRVGRSALLVAGLVVIQACLGVANVLLYIPVEITVLHSAGAAAIVLATTRFVREVFLAPLLAADSTLEPLPAEAK